ncbi:hypothetical protein F4808DRAFT_439232 [Astrocystis sublimbata]|nr:hypothetical protein F4808DRAFT_439232 [Astrocystis sublimbata]
MNNESYELSFGELSLQPIGVAIDEEHLLKTRSSGSFVEIVQPPGSIPPAKIPVKGSNASIRKSVLAWRWEIGASILVFASPAIILATLYPHNGHPLPQWSFSISLNTLLSIYTLVMKASLSFIATSCIGQLQWGWFSKERPLFDLVRYDNAGRGAWGSVQLLFAHRLRQPLATLGASLLVLSIGIDPSIQQLIGTFDCSVVVNGQKTTILRTSWFNNSDDNPIFYRDLNSALLRGSLPSGGQFGDGSVLGCVTGNCTFSEPYATSGYCSSCTDSSDEITVDAYCPTDDALNTSVGVSSYCSYNDSDTLTFNTRVPKENYEGYEAGSQLNTSFSLSAFSDSNKKLEVVAMSHYIDIENFDEPSDVEIIKVKVLAGKTSFSDKHVAISTGQTILGCEDEQRAQSWQCRGYGAATCSLRPCVRVYNATVKAGHFTEFSIEDSGRTVWGWIDKIPGGGYGLIDVGCLSSPDKSRLEESGYL